jgi:iron complex outermembrane recepter protein
VAASKTGTKLADIPGSVQTVPHELLYEQGATVLRQSLENASGVNFGGQDSKGFYDHFLIRGLNAQIYEDGFSDGDQLGGVSHSLNGDDHIEVVEGPGSALFGSGLPGGTINIVHYKAFFRSSLWRERAGGIVRHGRQQRLHYRLDNVTWIELPD